MKIAFFGTSEFALPILEALAAGQWRPELVVTTPDAPAGRGSELRSSPVKILAERLGIVFIQPPSLSPNLYPLTPGFDLFIVAAYGKILPPELLRVPAHGSLNVHPSLLPRWRGPAPIQYTILMDDTEIGVTIILMDEKVDHGPIIKNSKFEIRNSKFTTPELTAKLTEEGARLLLEVLPAWLAGHITPQPQDHTQATYSKILKKEDGHVDWSRPAVEIERMVRAFQPWPGAYAFWQRGKNRIRLEMESAASYLLPATSAQAVGTVFDEKDKLGIQTGQGVLIVTHLKPAGSRSMSASEFLNGHGDIIGSIVS